MRIGLKLWSTNDFYLPLARNLYDQRVFDYIELFIVPHSSNYIKFWKEIGIPVVLHAPHEMKGLNLSLSELSAQNLILIEEVEKYRLILDPDIIIFHPGVCGNTHETMEQIRQGSLKYPELFNNAVIENNPKFGINMEQCVGYHYQDLAEIIKEMHIGFCLDFGHAIVSSAAEHISWKEKINQLLELNPKIYHLSDGETGSMIDKHLHLGKGNFDLHYLLHKVPRETAMISLETPKDSQTDLEDFKNDVFSLKEMLR